MMRNLDDTALGEIARYFGALAAPLRLKVLNALREGERNVTELTAVTGASQANASKHLAVLAQLGVVDKSARGTSVYYRIADPRIYRICDLVCGQVGERLGRQVELGRALAGELRPSRRGRRPRARAGA